MALQPQHKRNSHTHTAIRRSGSTRKRQNSLFAPILVLLILTIVLAFIFSAAWQKIQGAENSSASDQQLSDLLALSSSRNPSGSPASIPSVDLSGVASQSQESQPEDSSEGASQSSSEKSGDSSAAASSSGNADTAIVGQPVPESDRVNTSYFDDALFLGDSITSGIASYGLMSNTTVIANTGINPSTMLTSAVWETDSGEMITLLDAAAQVDCEKIYVMIGANGIAWIGENTFIDYYSQIIERLQQDHPDAVIYVQSILPVTKEKSDEGPQMSNGKIDLYNQDILEMTEELGVYYLNVAEAIKDENGALPSDASPKDGIHFGTPTYQKWFDYLMTHVVDGTASSSSATSSASDSSVSSQ